MGGGDYSQHPTWTEKWGESDRETTKERKGETMGKLEWLDGILLLFVQIRLFSPIPRKNQRSVAFSPPSAWLLVTGHFIHHQQKEVDGPASGCASRKREETTRLEGPV